MEWNVLEKVDRKYDEPTVSSQIPIQIVNFK